MEDQEEEDMEVTTAAGVDLNEEKEIGIARNVILVTLPAEMLVTSVVLLNRAILC